MSRLHALALTLLLPACAFAQLALSPARLPNPTTGVNYYQEIRLEGGTAPYTWKVVGNLPPGISFDAPSATFTGVPTQAGSFLFRLTATDATGHSATRAYTLHVVEGGIAISWTKAPGVENGRISGEVEITNSGTEPFDLTFICVAVNEIGRATALGYQRFTLPPGSQRIPFGSTLPRGTYVVHADAVGEIARSRTIRRARLQTTALPVP